MKNSTPNGNAIRPIHDKILKNDEKSNQLERLFKDWRGMELKLNEMANNDDLDRNGEDCDHILAAQTVIMNTAAIINGSTYRDLLFKLAFWRWDAADLGNALDQMKRGDALAYSAFRDLVELTGETIVMTDIDDETKLLRRQESA